eukprot:TRINITY_DN26120_c0_g1_i3.p1 TRINITY_DN26120_c0_g1~~TRINITY_DN26120_c0_g1_i3.p1  ORF type:complete len:431 (-),score=40.29 TRINITY_DN26120_c0_g1_i3:245-1537(-)
MANGERRMNSLVAALLLWADGDTSEEQQFVDDVWDPPSHGLKRSRSLRRLEELEDALDEEEEEEATRRRRRRWRLLLLLGMTSNVPRNAPTAWIKWLDPQWTSFWQMVWVHGDERGWTDEDWHDNFRMSRGSFMLLCSQLKPCAIMNRAATNMRQPIPFEKRVAVAVWRLANRCCTFRQIRTQFGLGRKTASQCFWEFVWAICSLRDKYIRFPKTAPELRQLIAEFKARSGGYPLAVAAMDGSDFLVPAPALYDRDYQNRKFNSSIKMLSMSDARTRFLACDVREAGSVPDHDAWNRSSLKTGLEKLQGLLWELAEELGTAGQKQLVPAHIINDHIFPHRPFTQQNFPNPTGRRPGETEWMTVCNTAHLLHSLRVGLQWLLRSSSDTSRELIWLHQGTVENLWWSASCDTITPLGRNLGSSTHAVAPTML